MKVDSELLGKSVEIWSHGRYSVYIIRHLTHAKIYPSLDDLVKGEVLRNLHTDFEYLVVDKEELSILYNAKEYNFEYLRELHESDQPKPGDVVFFEKEETIFIALSVFKTEKKVITECGDTLDLSALKVISDRKELEQYFNSSTSLEISERAIQLITQHETNLNHVPKRESTIRNIVSPFCN